ncbi:Putative transmembrane protein [hydrothermal vent metagenome]|uniref:Transmembrane protein n=1 Tax=hydrothermal vent metagenome TaxID=652676 RepID=A0A3B0Z0V2_9ZZZZ
MEITVADQVLLATFVVTVIMGAVANKTNFCTMGAVSDVVNMGDTGRMRAWFFAIAIAMVGVMVFESLSGGSVDHTLPPYRSAGFAWARYLVGGLIFGIGMTLASGCANKTLIRLGGGNLKSLFVLLVVGIFAYLMTKTDFYALLFHPWVQATTIDLVKLGISYQDIGAMISARTDLGDMGSIRLMVGVPVALAILLWVFKSRDFRSSWDNLLGGGAIGLAVAGGWFITGGPLGREWIESAEWLDEKPINVAVQSYTFVNPMGELLAWMMAEFNPLLLSFGLVSLGGVIVGSFAYALVSGKFRFEWFSSVRDFISHIFGAMLMGIGGVLAMGCTLGQGVTGMSTMALGSFMALGAIIFGSALTMKYQYYKLLYEAEATVGKTLVTALVELRLLPQSMRKLKAL